MSFNAKKGGLVVLLAGLSAAPFLPASASLTDTLTDTYTGGIDPYAAVTSKNSDGSSTLDSVGGTPFAISSANVTLTGQTLSVTINTSYAGKAGTDGTNYGDLLLNSTWSPLSTTSASTMAAAWNKVLPSGDAVTANSSLVQATIASKLDNAAGGYLGDVYQQGDWSYAVVMLDKNGKPITGDNSASASSGKVALYAVMNSTTSMVNGGGMVLSHAGDCSPGDGSDCNSYYRAGEAVEYIPETGQQAMAMGTYSINAATGAINYTFSEAGTTLGDNFAVSWAMTCANDIIQGMVHLPEPGAWAMLVLGMVGLGGVRWRMRRSVATAV